jgi:hypothetical protein
MIARWVLAFCRVKDAVIIHYPPDWDNIADHPTRFALRTMAAANTRKCGRENTVSQ